MGKAFIQEETLINIANAIRQKNLSDIKYKPAEMPAAILALTSFSDEQKQAIADALIEKGVYVNINELTLDNISEYILKIKADPNAIAYNQLRIEYNELITYSQNKLNIFNNTDYTVNLYPELDESQDIPIQIETLTNNLAELKNYIIDKLGGI